MNKSAKLFKLAQQASLNAYAPYSQFAVGASLIADNGNYYSGCNIENVSYPCGSCAEQGAISAMIADGGKKIVEILILGYGKELITPCGACRQRILEFSDSQTLIHLADKEGIKKTFKINELLPYNFNTESLNND